MADSNSSLTLTVNLASPELFQNDSESTMVFVPAHGSVMESSVGSFSPSASGSIRSPPCLRSSPSTPSPRGHTSFFPAALDASHCRRREISGRAVGDYRLQNRNWFSPDISRSDHPLSWGITRTELNTRHSSATCSQNPLGDQSHSIISVKSSLHGLVNFHRQSFDAEKSVTVVDAPNYTATIPFVGLNWVFQFG
ncbi:hypothetical protein B0H34DRAFT_735373 [Crassisporium funariophilum]|nr:hypothetical protein B0H34DRAFT_735373 [Crassisporium funariophilum]